MPKKASQSSAGAHDDRYTDPALRDKIKEKIMAGDKGGKPGQWSARKAQLVASEYEHAGGGYKQEADEQQKSLQHWGDEHWRTSDGDKAEREGGTTRYLPDEAWNKLSKEEQDATNRKKQKGSKAGKQFVANTQKATAATKGARKSGAAKKTAAKAPAAKKGAAKKSAGKTPAKKTSAKKSPAKKSSAKKAPAKSPARKATASKSAVKSPVRKTAAKKTSTAKKTAGKTTRKSAGRKSA